MKEKGHSQQYTCPMHPEIISDKPGKCPKCVTMDLVPVESVGVAGASSLEPTKSKFATFRPLIIIFGLLTLASIIQVFVLNRQVDDLAAIYDHMSNVTSEASPMLSNWQIFMTSFMGGFFVIFAGFKLLDVHGFAHGYQTYDLIAQRIPAYGLVYPFIELTLGILFLLQFELKWVSAITALVSLIGLISVARKLRKHERIQCVCLGTVFDLPLTNVTLFENLIMLVMSSAMLAM